MLKPSADLDHGEEDLLTRLYRRVMGPLIASSRRRAIFLAGVGVLLLAAVAFLPLELVTVKMMPFDNKSDFQVMIDMPEGTALETTARVASAMASATLDDETVVNVQQYGWACQRRTTSTASSGITFSGARRTSRIYR